MSDQASAPAAVSADKTGLDFAWRLHDAVLAHTTAVDQKASIALALETAIFGTLLAVAQRDTDLTSAGSVEAWLLGLGLAVLLVGIVAAGGVVLPRINRREVKMLRHHDFIFFGRLRQWSPEQLSDVLSESSPNELLQRLSTQLVEMAQVAWRKHSWLQWSMGLGLGGSVLGLAAVALAT